MEEIEEPPLYLIDLCNLFDLRPSLQYAGLLLLLAKLQSNSEPIERRVLNFLKMEDLSLNYKQAFEFLASLKQKVSQKTKALAFSLSKLIPTYESMKLINQGKLSFKLNISYKFKKRSVHFELAEEGSREKEKRKCLLLRKSRVKNNDSKIVDYLNVQTGKNLNRGRRPQEALFLEGLGKVIHLPISKESLMAKF